MINAPVGGRRRRLIKKLARLYRAVPDKLSESSVEAVNVSLQSGAMEPYGIAKAPWPIDNLGDSQKRIALKCAEQFAEYEFLIRNNMTSFSDYRYFSPFWASQERFQVMNRTLSGFSSLSTIEGVPNLRVLFHSIDQPLKNISMIRQRSNAVRFRTWLEQTAGDSPDIDVVRSYLDAISGQRVTNGTTGKKLLKTVALAVIGVGVCSVTAGYAGMAAGAAAGVGSTLAAVAAEKLAEFATETGLGLFDNFILDNIAKGWSPRMFFDDLSKITRKNAT